MTPTTTPTELAEALLDVAIAICTSASDTVFMNYKNLIVNITAYDHITSVLGVEMHEDESPLDAVVRAKAALKAQAPTLPVPVKEIEEAMLELDAVREAAEAIPGHGAKQEVRDAEAEALKAFETHWPALHQIHAGAWSGWRDISSAPRDGSTILIARYDETFGWVRGTSQWVDDLGGNWLSRGVRGVADGLGLAHPTHWKPFDPPTLPDAPTPPSEGE